MTTKEKTIMRVKTQGTMGAMKEIITTWMAKQPTDGPFSWEEIDAGCDGWLYFMHIPDALKSLRAKRFILAEPLTGRADDSNRLQYTLIRQFIQVEEE
jgi:hypothetical protein